MNLGSFGADSIDRFGKFETTWFEGRWYTNTEMEGESIRLGNALKSLGIKKGDSVAIQMPNHPVVLWGFPAIYKLGAVVVPVNPLLRPDQAAYIYQDCGASVVITSPEYVPWIQAAQKQAPVLKTIVVIEKDDMPGTIGYDKFVAGQPDRLPVVETDNDDLAALIYTAGTTGMPKGVMHTHFSLFMTAIGYGDFVNRYRSTTLTVKSSKYDVRSHRIIETEQEVTGVDRRGLGLLVLPLSHSYGIATVTMGSMSAARALVLRWFNPELCLKLIQEHRVTNFSGVPAMYIMMLGHPDFDKYDLSSIQECACGAAPLPPEVGRMWEQKVGTPILEGWGMTETGATTCGTIPNRPPKYGSIGVCMSRATTMKIFDDKDNELPVGQTGEIVVKGPNIMKGYWNKPRETAEALRNGWLHTGDVGHVDEDGYFWITDRKKDIIIRGGENVSPREVEEVILLMPQVVEAGCIGIADKTYGEEIKACVVVKQGDKLTEEEVIAFCKERLPNFKIPKVVRFMDALPKNLLGKLLRAELRKQEKEQKS